MNTEQKSPPLFTARLLAKNTIWNLLGQGLPLLLAVVSVPPLVSKLGAERFGILSLAWLVIGYFGLFDLGIGRALTGVVANRTGAGHHRQLPSVIWTSLALMALLGCVGTLVMVLISPWLIESVLTVDPGLRAETKQSFYWLAFALPVILTTSGLRGVLEAKQQFGTLNLIRTPMSMLNYVLPLVAVTFTDSLVAVIVCLVVARVVGCVAHLVATVKVLPELRETWVVDIYAVLPVLRLGAWLTVSNVVGPLMVYADRFMIGMMVSMTAVAYYTAPSQVVTQITLLPAALVSVLFPAFALAFAKRRADVADLLKQGTKYVFLAVVPLVLVTIVFAPEGLRLWLGEEFARESSGVVRWLALGVLLSSLSQVPFAMIQGAGRPEVTAGLHLIELPLYFLALRWAIGNYGITGAAIAWTARTALDAAFLFWTARRLVREETQAVGGPLLWLAAALVALAVAPLFVTLAAKVAYSAVAIGVFGALMSRTILALSGGALVSVPASSKVE